MTIYQDRNDANVYSVWEEGVKYCKTILTEFFIYFLQRNETMFLMF